MSARQPGREASVRALAEHVQQIGWTCERVVHVFADAQGLHPTDFRALTAIYRAELAGAPLSAKGLARALDVRPSTVTYAVDRLVAAGHARRERDPADARRTILCYGQPRPRWGPVRLASCSRTVRWKTLARAIRAMADGRMVMDPRVARSVLAPAAASGTDGADALAVLSRGERLVAQEVADGLLPEGPARAA